jgi:hypothetical protein
MRKIGLATLAVLAMAGQAAGADEPGVPGEVRLTKGEDVSAVCAAVTEGAAFAAAEAPDLDAEARDLASASVYVVTLSPAGFGLGQFDDRRGRLPIDAARGFHSRSGGFELVLGDLAGGRAVTGLEMAIPTTAEDAVVLRRGHRAGLLTLTIWFRVARGGDMPSCAVVHRGGTSGVRMAIEPLAYLVRREGEPLASGETDDFAALRAEGAPVLTPRVIVSAPLLTGQRGAAPDAVARAAAALEPALRACYQAGLAADATLRGTLVLGVVVDRAGRPTEVRAELDGVGEPLVTDCAVDLVRAARFPRGAAPFSIPVKFTSD